MNMRAWGCASLAFLAGFLFQRAATWADDAVAKPSGLIVFSSNRSGPWRIWSLRLDGSAPRQITHAQPDEQDVDPALSPDGKRLLFTSTRGKTTGIWKVALDGKEPTRITDGDQVDWSADGKSIVLRRKEEIVTRELATGREQVLVRGKDWPHCSGPAWSPNGKTIAFACRWDAANALFTVPAAGGEDLRRRLGPLADARGRSLGVSRSQGLCHLGPGADPPWLPAGVQLLFNA